MNTRYAAIFALSLCTCLAGQSNALAGPGGLVGVPSNGSMVTASAAGGNVGNAGAAQMPTGGAGMGGGFNAPSVQSSSGVSARSGANDSSPGSHTIYDNGSSSPVVRSQSAPTVRSQIGPQTPATSGYAVGQTSAVRQAYVQPDQRAIAGSAPVNRYTVQSAAGVSNFPNRYNNANGRQNLSQATLARAAADRNNTRLVDRSTFYGADHNRPGDHRRDQRRPRLGFYYGNYFPAGIYNSYSPYYSAYPYFTGSGYGYPYTALTTNGYLNNYGFVGDGGDYSLDSVVPNDAAPAVQPSVDDRQPEATAGSGTIPAQSDTLVQDVQAELARRGYFAGKIDGVVSSTFQAALRRFQTDLKLAPTGLINQASLFALGLN